MKLKIAENFSLPLEAVTETFGILAIRGAGKSNAAVVMAEEMFRAGLHWVAIDPKGDWWGIRANGDKPGLPIPIFGGRHGDVPLESTAGEMIADLIADENLTCVLDVSEFSEGEKIRFLLAFADRLFRRKNGEQDPTHLFAEECDDYIPQKPFREQARLVHSFQKLVKQGRSRGLGVTLISQRSAVVNKDVLTQVETLISMRTMSPQDRKAIEAWVSYHGERPDILKTLPTLQNGEAWIWSPHFLKTTKRILFRRRETYDSGATPSVRKARRTPATLADVDLCVLRKRMTATIERAKQEDPRELRRKIAELEREVKKPNLMPSVKSVSRTVEVSVLKDTQIKRLESALGKLQILAGGIGEAAQGVLVALRGRQNVPPSPVRSVETVPASPSGLSEAVGSLERGPKAMLSVLAQFPSGRTKVQLGILSGYSPNSGTFGVYLGSLRSRGFVTGGADCLRITKEGLNALGDYQPMPTGKDLVAYWMGKLGRGEGVMLKALIDVYPQAMSKEQLGEASGFSATSGTFGVYLGKLRTLELVSRGQEIRAAEEFFQWPHWSSRF